MQKKLKNVEINSWKICSSDKGLSISEVCFLDLEERFQNDHLTSQSSPVKKDNFQCYRTSINFLQNGPFITR